MLIMQVNSKVRQNINNTGWCYKLTVLFKIGSIVHACDNHIMTLDFFIIFCMPKPTKAIL